MAPEKSYLIKYPVGFGKPHRPSDKNLILYPNLPINNLLTLRTVSFP